MVAEFILTFVAGVFVGGIALIVIAFAFDKNNKS